MRVRADTRLVVKTADETSLVTMLRARPDRSPDPSQHVLLERFDIRGRDDVPVKFDEYLDVFGNRCQRLHVPAGEHCLSVETEALVWPTVAAKHEAPRTPIRELPNDVLQFISPSRYCPSDRHQALARQVVGTASGYAEVARICAFVHDKLEYRYGVSDGSTCAEQTLRAGAGVCRDFAHTAISLCRALDIPARMAVGYLHGLSPMDLHAWFEAYVGGRWYTFDPTEDTLCGGRLVLGYGRDAADVPFLTDYGSLRLESMAVSIEDVTYQLAEAAE